MRKNIFLQGDSIMIAFIMLVFLGIGVNLVYSIYFYEVGESTGMWYSVATVVAALLLVNGIINYNKLAFYLYLLVSLAIVAYGIYQIIYQGTTLPVIQTSRGYVDIILGMVALLLLFGNRHRYVVKYNRSRNYY
ncbi:MAG: hypothetical protein ACYC2T_03275 [Bacillota bacterium]